MTNGVAKCTLSAAEYDRDGDKQDVKQFFKEETIRKAKSVAGHVGLLIALMLYTAIGGLVSLNGMNKEN